MAKFRAMVAWTTTEFFQVEVEAEDESEVKGIITDDFTEYCTEQASFDRQGHTLEVQSVEEIE